MESGVQPEQYAGFMRPMAKTENYEGNFGRFIF